MRSRYVSASVSAIVAVMSNAVVVAQTSKQWRAAKPAGHGMTRAHVLKKTAKRLIARHPTAQGGVACCVGSAMRQVMMALLAAAPK